MTGVAQSRALLRQRATAASRDRWSRPDLLAHQERSFAELRAFVYERSAFYRRFHAGLFERPLSELPILTKSIVMERFDELVTDPTIRLRDVEAHLATTGSGMGYLGDIVVSGTSGTSGQRGLFLVDGAEWETLTSTYRRALWWTGFFERLAEPPRFAFLFSLAPLHISAQMSDASAKTMQALVLDTNTAIGELVKSLNEWQPHYLGSYPTVARYLAEEQLAGRLRIAPAMLSVGGELVTNEATALIEKAWGKVIHPNYATTETGAIATECELHDGLHVLEDLMIIENVDAGGAPVPPDVLGERVLATVLFRRRQPLIRYEITDKIRMAPELCPCGRPSQRIASIQGRTFELLRFETPQGAEIEIDTILFREVLDGVPARQWQVSYDAHAIDVRLAAAAADLPESVIVEPLRRGLVQRGVRVPAINVVHVPEIERGATGKAVEFRRRSSEPT